MSKRTVATPAVAAFILLAAAGFAHAGGSGIDVAAEVAGQGCSGPLTSLQIDAAITASAAAPYTFSVSANGITVAAATFANWTSYGRTKGAEQTLQVLLPPGIPTVTVCALQAGANGNAARSACVAVTVPQLQCDGGSGSGMV
jgi:hypothetical protein